MSLTILRPHLTRRTARLSVRPLAPDDLEAWRTAYLEHPPADSPFDTGARPASELTRAAFRSLLQRNARLRRQDVFHQFALFDREEKALLGIVGVQVVARTIMQMGWIGWRVFGQHRRRGYAREGALAVLDMAFRELLLHRVEAGIEPGNHASARLARSVGMRKEGTDRRSAFIRGGWQDLDVYAIHSEDCGIECVPTIGLGVGDERQVVEASRAARPAGE